VKRRTLLRGLAAAGTLTLTAGCLGDGSPDNQPTDDNSTDTGDPTDTSTPTDDETPTDTDGHVDTVSGTDRDPEPSDTPDGEPGGALSVTGSSCGAETDDASVSFDGSAVAITGTIWGNDACYTATLADTRLENGTLTVVVAAESDAGTDRACAECITEIDYEVDVAFDGSLPAEVVVEHEHGDSTATVTTATR
jgi:hypothetical protein